MNIKGIPIVNIVFHSDVSEVWKAIKAILRAIIGINMIPVMISVFASIDIGNSFMLLKLELFSPC